MASIRLVYDTYDVDLTDFVDGALPRTFVATAALTRSATGAQVLSGTPYATKYIWAINAIVTKEVALQLMDMFAAWDAERATGTRPSVTLTDTTFGATISGPAVITTAPTVQRWGGASSRLYSVALGLTQI